MSDHNPIPQQAQFDFLETWRPVPDFEDHYEVSNLGQVRRIKGGRGAVAGKILTLERLSKKGYPTVYLHKVEDGIKIRQPKTIHQLVIQVFIGPPPTPSHQVNHRNGIKTDNRPANLEWVTNEENMTHSWQLGLRSYFGEGNHKAKLTEDNVYAIIAAKGKTPQRELARQYGMHVNQIKSIHRGITWKHITRRPDIAEQLAHAPRDTSKGTTRGERNGNAKLTEQDVKEIKRLLPTHSNRQLANRYGVCLDCIYRIRKGGLWAWVEL